jgi:hypothetical protein
MRAPKRRLTGVFAALIFALASVASGFAQVAHPIDVGPGKPIVQPRPRPIVRPTFAPAGVATPGPSAPTVLPTPQNPADIFANSRLGPAVPLSQLARLPRQTAANTASVDRARIPLSSRRPMSAEFATMDYAEVANCGSSVGAIFNVGCTIKVRGVQAVLHDNDTLQNYYIDATNNLAQTLGGTYSINSFGGGGNNFWGPYSNLTLSNQGTYVLGEYDVTAGVWLAVTYITVGSANGIITYSDNTLRIPSTNFLIPAAGQTYVYINVLGLPPSDNYVTYIEQTSTTPQCVYYAPAQTGVPGNNRGLCDPNSSVGQTAPGGTLTIAWPVTNAYVAATYSIVVWDKTQQRRIAQTQVSLATAAGAAMVNLTPTAGNPSPAPVANPTPGTRFAFNNTSDSSDSAININMSGLTNGNFYCFTITNPNGQIYTDQPSQSYDVTCGRSNGSLSLTDTLLNNYQPLNYAPNTYTVSAYDIGSGYVAISQAFQVLGYNAVTQFTNPAGTSVTGNALVLPLGSNAQAGLQFTNDGDTYFGVGNGDTLSGIVFDTTKNGITIDLPCGVGCGSETVTDSTGQTWTVTLVTTGGGANKESVLTLYPQTPGQKLAMNASIVLPNLTFNNAPGLSRCTGGCTADTSILPTDGLSWSLKNNPSSSNPVFFTNGGGNTFTGTASVTHLGTTATGSGYVGGAAAGEEQHGYYPRQIAGWSGALYSSNEPFSAPLNISDVYAVTVQDGSSAGSGNVTGLAIVFPAGYASGSYAVQPSVDPNSPSKWQVDAANCPAGLPPNGSICLKPLNPNTGVAPSASQTIYLDVKNDPSGSFAYTDFTVEAYKPAAFTLAPAAQQNVFVGQATPVDSTAVAAYSLDGGLITPLFTPQSEGTNTSNPVQISVQNAATSQDPFPDYVDALVIELPNGVANPASFSSLSPAAWQYLGSAPGFGASTTDYWFGVCASQFATADGPVQNPPPVKPSLPSCGQAVEQNALAPGATFQFTTPITTGNTAGTITGTMYAHGANGNGWSRAHDFNLSVTAVAATAGFVQVGAYGAPSVIPSNTTPQIGADTNTTFGNSFVYEIANASSAGNTINSAKITIPYLDTSGADARDNNGTGQGWQITAAPTLSGSGWTNCAATYTNPTGGSSNGFINIVNSGGACKIAPGGKLDVNFSMKAPYRVNENAQFPAVVNGNVNATENWFSDTTMQIVLSAQLAISVWPSADPLNGGNASPSCTLACTFIQATNLLDFGTIANNSNNTGADVVQVSVFTNAANPVGWQLYVSSNNNPANALGPPNNELLHMVDSAHSTGGAGMNFDSTVFTVIPTAGNGTQLVDTGAGAAARRQPYDVVNDIKVQIAGGSTAAQTSILTYTFISN